jgi:DNA-binding MarR family transcriptional regulator
MLHPADPELPGPLQFMRLMWALEHALQKTSKRMTRQLGVSGLQRLALRIIGLSPGMSAGRLARVLHVHPSTLTGVLQRLTDQGLIDRVEHNEDRRRAVLHLTARGKRINALRRRTVEAGVRAALQGVSPRDQRIARQVLNRICEQLENGNS